MVESEKTGIFYIDPSMVDMIPIGQIKPYKRNAKKHPQDQIDQIIASIKEFGMNDPIGVWGKDNIIVEGHGRYLALRQMGESGEVPVIHLDNLTDEQRKAYALAHNKLTMNSDFDLDLLEMELAELDIDMVQFGFENDEEIAENIETKEEPPVLTLPDSHVLVASISAFGTESECFIEAVLDSESAEILLQSLSKGTVTAAGIAEKIKEVIHAL